MNTLLIGVGAAGDKAVVNAVNKGIVDVEDSIIINSTSKDFPEGYEGKKIVLSPNNYGCGKEVQIARGYALNAIKEGKMNLEEIKQYTSVIFCTSIEGGTGSGATPLLAQFVKEVYKKNTHIIAFAGFEEDVRGLQNSIEFFKNIDKGLIIQVIRNSAFLKAAKWNKFDAEQMANEEMNKRIELLTGKNFIFGTQNIDDTDIMKVSNTPRYMTVEHIDLEESLLDREQFDTVIRKMIHESKSLMPENPDAQKFGVILNIKKESEKAIDPLYTVIKEIYGKSFESFTQKQWDGQKEYIGLIVSGMRMPVEEVEKLYQRYREESERLNKDSDSFFEKVQSMDLDGSNKQFDMFKEVDQTVGSVSDFLSQFSTPE